MSRTIAIARPGIGEEERQMILDTAAEAGYEVCFVSGSDVTDEMLDAEILYGEGEAVSEAAAASDNLKWLCASAGPAHLIMIMSSSLTAPDPTVSPWQSMPSCWR